MPILYNQKVADDAGMNPRDLARWASVTTGGMTVVRLEKEGFARRHPNPADRRSCVVHLIPESLRRFESAYQPMAEMLAGVAERYSDKDLCLLIDFLERVSG